MYLDIIGEDLQLYAGHTQDWLCGIDDATPIAL